MRFLVHILMAIAVMAYGQAVRFEGHPRTNWIPLLVLLPYGLVVVATRAGMMGRFRLAFVLGKLAHLSGVLAYALCVVVFGWIEVVRDWSGQALEFEAWPQWGLLVAFAPFVVYQLACIHAESVAMRVRSGKIWSMFRFQTRMFASALAPFLVYVLISILFARSDTLRVHIESVRLIEGAYLAFLFALFGGLMPALLSSTWETNPLPPGQARDLFQHVAARADFRSREVLLWNTGDSMANAAIVGLSARSRVVLLSDSLLAMLGPRELACVYGHEIGHSKRHHVPIFLGWTVFFLMGGNWLAGTLFPHSDWGAMAVVGIALVLWYVCFGWMSRRFELEADLYSMQLTGDPEALIQALERVGGGARDQGGWRHFSTARRVQFLHRAAFDEVFRLRFLRRIRSLGKAGLVLGGVVLVVSIVSMARHFGEDRLHARLTLGTYAPAWGQSDTDLGTEPEFASLLELASQIANPDGSRVPLERVESALQDALTQGDFDLAVGWAQLLSKREQPDADRLLEQMRIGPWPLDLNAGLEDWPIPWRGYALEGLEALRRDREAQAR
ncbi:MAG TPA: M48 family metallopeptidase [Planctomycetota bacterium]|nr:M48 family metallopeptidase [Planctomycetota bacterium]HRV80028.1 M48 family metallopeptidase [Planctomycetota bacterium]